MRLTATRSLLILALGAGLFAAHPSVRLAPSILAQEAPAAPPQQAGARGGDGTKDAAVERAKARQALKEELAHDVAQLEAFSRAFRTVAKLVSPSVVNIHISRGAGAEDGELGGD